MFYDVLDISEYVLSYCESKEKPISNLKLQKILFYIQCEHIRRNKKVLFDNKMECWTYGICIPDSYLHYNSWSSTDIFGVKLKEGIVFNDDTKLIMDKIINKYIDWNTWQLVESNQKEKIWKDNFIDGFDYKNIGYYQIGNNELIEYVLGDVIKINIDILESEKFLITYEKSINVTTVQEKRDDNNYNYFELDGDLDKLKDLGELILKFVELNTI
ncbi:MAG: Panacea domain-containing protein [Clostridium chrysemydis]|uniref:Panacea domain-containing protein n=1 Tax=Clostridium chrysemydis TaxID=2665504 RepID=UPI003F3B88CD